jgi:hypothetical protein
MIGFLEAATSFPSVIYSVLLGVVLVYWLLSLIGVVDIDSGPVIEAELHTDADADEIGDFASYLMALGLNGVPFSVVVSLLVLLSWTITCLAAMWLLPLVPTSLLRMCSPSSTARWNRATHDRQHPARRPEVTFTGRMVYPIIHKAELMDISLKTIEIDRRATKA